MEVRNILVINQPLGNRGDESAHKALIRALNAAYRDARITVLFFMDHRAVSKDMEVVDARNEYVRFSFPHNLGAEQLVPWTAEHNVVGLVTRLHPILRRLIPLYRRADLIVNAPGGICMGGFQNWRHLYFLLLAKALRKPVAYYSRSIGPFPVVTASNRRFRCRSEELLAYMSFISLRDTVSQHTAQEMSVPFVPSIDTAFLEQPRAEVPADIQALIGAAPYIVFVPNSLCWHFAYRSVPQAQIDGFYHRLLELLTTQYPDCRIVMLPQLYKDVINSDYQYFTRLAANDSHRERIVVVPDTCSSDLQQTLIARARFSVGARYHSIVFAVNNEVPFLALSYEHKVSGMLQSLDLSDHTVDITDAFRSEESIMQVLSEVERKLGKLAATPVSRRDAAALATTCFEAFHNTIQKL